MKAARQGYCGSCISQNADQKGNKRIGDRTRQVKSSFIVIQDPLSRDVQTKLLAPGLPKLANDPSLLYTRRPLYLSTVLYIFESHWILRIRRLVETELPRFKLNTIPQVRGTAWKLDRWEILAPWNSQVHPAAQPKRIHVTDKPCTSKLSHFSLEVFYSYWLTI